MNNNMNNSMNTQRPFSPSSYSTSSVSSSNSSFGSDSDSSSDSSSTSTASSSSSYYERRQQPRRPTSSFHTNNNRKENRMRRTMNNTHTNTNTSTRLNIPNVGGPSSYNKQCPQFPARKCYMALDCEMVGVGPLHSTNHRSSLARVVITDWKGDRLFDQHIKQSEPVTDYRTFVSGITENNLKYATMTLDICRTIVSNILFGHILVGHGLENDLQVLGIDHPWWMIRDTAFYEPFMNVRYYDNTLLPRKLKDLVLERLGKRIQVSGSPHSPIEDAKWAMNLYKSVRSDWEACVQYKIQRRMIDDSIGRLHSVRPPHPQQHQQPIHHHHAQQQAIIQSN